MYCNTKKLYLPLIPITENRIPFIIFGHQNIGLTCVLRLQTFITKLSLNQMYNFYLIIDEKFWTDKKITGYIECLKCKDYPTKN